MNIATELDLASNLFGKIKPDIRKRLEAVVAKPSQRTWNDTHGIVLDGSSFITLWQAVLEVDSTFCRSKPCDEPWPMIPSRATLISALRYATH